MAPAGATGRSELIELLAGSTALELPGRSHTPVVVVRPAADGTLADSGPVVVVGTRGRGRLIGVLIGSTSRAVIKLAPCPVAAVSFP